VARKLDLDAALLRVKELRRDPSAPGSEGALREILRSRFSHAAAKAAEVAGDAQLRELEPDLVAAFDRFLQDPSKRDPGCLAKTAIVDALQQLDSDEGDLYLRAARHVQLEPVYGGRQDTAPALRGAAARGLVRMNHPDAMVILAELLADAELPARIAAARALAAHGGASGLPLLRLKVLVGDAEIEVVSECLLALLRISGEDSTPFVARFLETELAEAALLALGESRAPEALPVLESFLARTADAALSRTALLALALLRSDAAIDRLIGFVEGEPGPIARDAIRAFEIYRNDERVVERVRQAVRRREGADLTATFEDVLG
jgi:HEAT repeat protein